MLGSARCTGARIAGMAEIRAIMTLLATMWRSGPGHADITGSHSTWAGWERHREKVIADFIGKDEVFTSCGVRARYSRVSFHFPFLLHTDRKHERKWCR